MLLGVGLGLFASPNTNAIMGSVERKYFGICFSWERKDEIKKALTIFPRNQQALISLSIQN